MTCNRLINEFAARDMNIFVADNSNLRENSYASLSDNKHVRKNKIGIFVVNIKTALCAAYGKQYHGRSSYVTNQSNAGGQNESSSMDMNPIQSRLLAISHGEPNGWNVPRQNSVTNFSQNSYVSTV